MKERPILFQGAMVRALLAGTKTQTRRLMKPQPSLSSHDGEPQWPSDKCRSMVTLQEAGCLGPYGSKSDRLWVRESLVLPDDDCWRYEADGTPIELAREDERYPAMLSWAHHNERERCNSIHMPRWASRITLEVTSVRVERLHAITEEDAKAEGVTPPVHSETWLCVRKGGGGCYEVLTEPGAKERAALAHVERQPARPMWAARPEFELLWNKINGKRAAWSTNPWVWVVGFRRLP